MTTRTTAGLRVFWADDEDDAARSDDTVSRLGATCGIGPTGSPTTGLTRPVR